MLALDFMRQALVAAVLVGIAAPMIGGLAISFIVELLLYPVLFTLYQTFSRKLRTN